MQAPRRKSTLTTGEPGARGDLLERLSVALWDLREELDAAERELRRMELLLERGRLAPDVQIFTYALARQNALGRDHLQAIWSSYTALRAA